VTVVVELGDDLRAHEAGASDDYDLHDEPPLAAFAFVLLRARVGRQYQTRACEGEANP
jgi:hypothetical protein